MSRCAFTVSPRAALAPDIHDTLTDPFQGRLDLLAGPDGNLLAGDHWPPLQALSGLWVPGYNQPSASRLHHGLKSLITFRKINNVAGRHHAIVAVTNRIGAVVAGPRHVDFIAVNGRTIRPSGYLIPCKVDPHGFTTGRTSCPLCIFMRYAVNRYGIRPESPSA